MSIESDQSSGESPVSGGEAGVFAVPASAAQQRFWLVDQTSATRALYNTPVVYRVSGPLDVDALRRSFAGLVQRHESLRTTFAERDGVLTQRIAPTGSVPLRVVAASSDPAVWLSAVRAEITVPFDLARGPLMRAAVIQLDADDHVLVITGHHVIFDGWSETVLFDDLEALYAAARSGEAARLPELAVQYADFAVWQAQAVPSDAIERSLDYWRRQLGDLATLALPSDRPRPRQPTMAGALRELAVPPSTTAAIRALARRCGTTTFVVTAAAFQALLQRYTGQGDIPIGVITSGRTRSEVERLIGCFINTIVLRGDLSDDPNFVELVRRTGAATLEAHKHTDAPFERVVEALGVHRDPSRHPLFQVLFNFSPVGRVRRTFAGLSLTRMPIDTGLAKFDLTLELAEVGDELCGSIEYSSELFDAPTIDRLISHFTALLEGAAQSPETPVSALPMLTPTEREQLIAGWHEPSTVEARHETVVALFAAQAARTPDAPAVVCGDDVLTYADVRRAASRLAHRLQTQHGVRPGARVGLSVERSAAMVPALLGILATGAAYVPLDPAYPTDRLAFMREDAGVSAIVKAPRSSSAFEGSGVALVDVDEPDAPGADSSEAPFDASAPDAFGYVMYTSGSMGTPKGVAVTHRTLSEHCQDVQRVYALTPADRVLQFASLNFDPSVEQIFSALVSGACLVVRGNDVWGAAEFAAETTRHGVTVADLATAYWAQLAYAAADVTSPTVQASTLRIVTVGGEAMSVDALAAWRRTPYAHARLLNMYGPTEATVTATFFEVMPSWTPAAGERVVPIGRPFGRRLARVLDGHGSLVPIGVVGELCLGGTGLATGYLNQPALTERAFIPDPFDETPGARLYRTGDLVRYLAGGTLSYVGRRDEQVKVNGFRVEPGEIEAALQRHPAVAQAIVVVRDDGGGTRLVAYVIAVAGATADPDDLRRSLATTMPDYLVPAAIVVVDEWPLTPSGKIDRKRLPAPAATAGVTTHVAPRTEVERRIATVWADVLNVADVGVDDTFFELGGHSLLAMRLAARLSAAFGVDVSIRRLFESPTVAGLADHLERTAAPRATASRIARPITRQPRMPRQPAHE
ncbi:MAG TPA: amino acid adenylation domain-containing protein [Vicinamibacterales bacterium]|nr:amino acid adenylation domain-containing protein [Vicinamibacterales bacterium]